MFPDAPLYCRVSQLLTHHRHARISIEDGGVRPQYVSFKDRVLYGWSCVSSWWVMTTIAVGEAREVYCTTPHKYTTTPCSGGLIATADVIQAGEMRLRFSPVKLGVSSGKWSNFGREQTL